MMPLSEWFTVKSRTFSECVLRYYGEQDRYLNRGDQSIADALRRGMEQYAAGYAAGSTSTKGWRMNARGGIFDKEHHPHFELDWLPPASVSGNQRDGHCRAVQSRQVVH